MCCETVLFVGWLGQDLKTVLRITIFETEIPDNFNWTQVHSGVARLVALNPNVKVPASETSLHPREVTPWSGCHSGFPPRQSISFHPLIDPSIYQSINTWIHPIHEIAPWVRMPYRFSIHYTPSTFDIRKTTTFIKLTKQIRRNARLNLNQEPLPLLLHAVPGGWPKFNLVSWWSFVGGRFSNQIQPNQICRQSKKSQFTLRRKKSKTELDFEDMLCPLASFWQIYSFWKKTNYVLCTLVQSGCK